MSAASDSVLDLLLAYGKSGCDNTPICGGNAAQILPKCSMYGCGAVSLFKGRVSVMKWFEMLAKRWPNLQEMSTLVRIGSWMTLGEIEMQLEWPWLFPQALEYPYNLCGNRAANGCA